MNKMLSSRYWRFATVMLVLVSASSWAHDASMPVVRSEFRKVEATVTAIDPVTREATLRGPNGTMTLLIDREVRNLDKVRVGDKVVVSYYQGLAAQIAKGNRRASEPIASQFAYRAPRGQRPSGGAGTSITTTVTIEDIDTSTNTVAFRRSDGSVHIIAVTAPNMIKFIRTLKPGDSVEITYTESVAVNVVPAPG